MKKDTGSERKTRFRKILDAQPKPESSDPVLATLQAAKRLQASIAGTSEQPGDRDINAIQAMIRLLKSLKKKE